MKEFHDNFPLNAIVKVDYKTNSASFDYPNGKENRGHRRNAVWISVFPSWLVLVTIVFFIGVAPTIFHNIEIMNKVESKPFPLESLFGLFKEFALFILVYTVPIIITDFVTINYKYFSTVFPKYNFYLMKKIFRKRTKIVRLEKLDSTLFTVPIFGNVMMEYDASGEFSEFLERVEILPVDFKYWDGEEEKSEEYLWKANFHFSKVPTNGKLFIEYL